MYEEGALRPPTAADMLQGRIELERIRVEHGGLCDERRGARCRAEWHLFTASIVTPVELHRFCQDNGIPVQAHLESYGETGELLLSWNHLG